MIFPPEVRLLTASMASGTPAIPLTASSEMFVSTTPCSTRCRTVCMSTIREPDVPTRDTPRATMPARGGGPGAGRADQVHAARDDAVEVEVGKSADRKTGEGVHDRVRPGEVDRLREEHGHRNHDRHVRVAGLERLVLRVYNPSRQAVLLRDRSENLRQAGQPVVVDVHGVERQALDPGYGRTDRVHEPHRPRGADHGDTIAGPQLARRGDPGVGVAGVVS